jgi:hypothetical protein
MSAEQALEKFSSLKKARQNWDEQFQVVGEYVSQTKQSFLEKYEQGAFLNQDIFDSTATFAAMNASSALLGMLWPSSAEKSVKINPPKDMKDVTSEEKEYYDYMTETVTAAMDDPKANLMAALDEYMLDDIIFGTAGVGSFWKDDGLYFKSYGVMEMLIEEGDKGNVDTVAIVSKWTAKRIVDTYGEDSVSEKVLKAYEANNYNELFDVLILYQPRLKRGKSQGNMDMPFQSLHIEIATKTLLKEGGFDSFPIHVNRFRKLSYERYGRSPSMVALPDIREINIFREAVIVATEKMLDPPLGVMNDGILGNGVIDTSSGAVNVFDGQSSNNSPPVFPINTVGDLNAALLRIEALAQNIAQHFFIDRLLDFNNQTQMTATETAARAQIRASSLSTLLSRQISEVFLPFTERSVFLMYKNGKLGYAENTAEYRAALAVGENPRIIPERIAKRIEDGLPSYEVKFTTAADRANSVEELQGTEQWIESMMMKAQADPNYLAYVDTAGTADVLHGLYGASGSAMRSKEDAEQLINQSQQSQEQAMNVEQGQVIAQTAEAAANAEKTFNEG